MQYIAAYRPRYEYTDGPESFICYQYVDDWAFAEPCVGLRPWQEVSLWGRASAWCLGTKAIRQKKREVPGNTSEKRLLWGIAVAKNLGSPHPQEKIDRPREF